MRGRLVCSGLIARLIVDLAKFSNASGIKSCSFKLAAIACDIKAMSSRVNKQGKATITMSFDIHGIEELNNLMAKLRQIDGVLDIERTTG